MEMDTLLKTEKGWLKCIEGGEYVYHYTTIKNPDILIKVFSSVKVENGLGRKVGKDAIRICAINKLLNKGYRKSIRINRTAGWNERIKSKTIEMINTL
jgi:hypothetical protein